MKGTYWELDTTDLLLHLALDTTDLLTFSLAFSFGARYLAYVVMIMRTKRFGAGMEVCRLQHREGEISFARQVECR